MDKELESREFAEAYNSTLKQAERVTKENGRDISLAKDAVQETVLRLLVRKRKEEIRNWLAFLTTSVRRTLVKLIKHDELSSQKVQSLPISQVNSAERSHNHILISELENQVPEKELEIVRLYEFHGLNWEEIGTLKNITPEAARKRYYRSIKTIRKVLRIRTEDGRTKK